LVGVKGVRVHHVSKSQHAQQQREQQLHL
jgi:hypothetical protein